MEFSTLFSTLNALQGYPAAAIVLVTAVIVAHYWSWRSAIWALLFQYLAAGFLYADFLEPRHVFIKVLVGQFVCLILYITARQLSSEPGRNLAENGKSIPNGHPNSRFTIAKTILLLLAILIAYGAATQISLPGIASEHTHIAWTVWGLALISLLGLAHQRKAMPLGMSLLLFLAGFNLYYSYLVQTTFSFAVLAVLNMIIATAVAFLAQMPNQN